MRVRQLQSYLTEQKLVYQGKLEALKGTRIGVDAVFWLRSIQALKDPFADALGGIPPGIFGFVEHELESFRRHNLQPLFVFQGLAAGPLHSMFINRPDQQMDQAWAALAQGQKAEAQKYFAVSTSRINGDFVYFIFHHLRARGFECLQAPYFASAQLAHMVEQGVISTTLGTSGLLLYNVPSVIMQINWGQQTFDWIELESILKKWQLTQQQLVDACMLAGTEYCLTYPPLNMGPGGPGRQFSFDHVVNTVKQASLATLVSALQLEDQSRHDQVEGYCICKCLIENSPVLHLQEHAIRPFKAGGKEDHKVPANISTIMGEKLPNSMYYLVMQGIISHKLPQALAKAEWTDKSQPLVDTSEYRETLENLQDYRSKALGLIARHLHEGFQKKQILQKAFFEAHSRTGLTWRQTDRPGGRMLQPYITKGLRWSITTSALEAELARQGVKKVDFKFCLTWHSREFERDGQLMKNLTTRDKPSYSSDPRCLAALVHFMVLENLDLIEEGDGSATVLGNVLKDVPVHMQEPCLVALELMKIGGLNGDPYTPAQRPFPKAVKYPEHPTPEQKSRMLLSRVMSLMPMKLKSMMWNAQVDFDLSAFHAVVRILKRTLRQLVEASLTSVMLRDLTKVSLLPAGFMCATPSKENHYESQALLPPFMLSRACMGIVVQFFLDYEGKPEKFPEAVAAQFACCEQPVKDLQAAMAFWEELQRCVEKIAEPLGCEELLHDIKEASKVLGAKSAALGLAATK